MHTINYRYSNSTIKHIVSLLNIVYQLLQEINQCGRWKLHSVIPFIPKNIHHLYRWYTVAPFPVMACLLLLKKKHIIN